MTQNLLSHPDAKETLRKIDDLRKEIIDSDIKKAGGFFEKQEKSDTGKENQVDDLDLSSFQKFFCLKFRHIKNDENDRYEFFSSKQSITNHINKNTNEKEYWLSNLVLQGGGTLGLAHAGFITGMEYFGVRFIGLAGASAGAILVMGMAAIRKTDLTMATHEELIELIDSVPMDTFIDGPRPIRVLIKRYLLGKRLYMPNNWVNILSALKRMLSKRGLNQGESFELWLEKILAERGLNTIKDLRETLDCICKKLEPINESFKKDSFIPPLQSKRLLNTNHNQPIKGDDLFKITSTSMPTGVKFNFPEDLQYLHKQYSTVSPARLVRASMSIPLFFDPIFMSVDRGTWEGEDGFVRKKLKSLMGKAQLREIEDLSEIAFLDGGLFSNLPTDAFEKTMPDVPVVCVPLVKSQRESKVTRNNSIKGLLNDTIACASAVRLQRDRDAKIRREQDEIIFDLQKQHDSTLNKSTPRNFPFEFAEIDTGDANWLNFVMNNDEKADLFNKGLERAEEFIRSLVK